MCKNCQYGQVYVPIVVTVSHDMAIDAGEPTMEGQSWDWGYEWITCGCCGGNWQACETCEHT